VIAIAIGAGVVAFITRSRASVRDASGESQQSPVADRSEDLATRALLTTLVKRLDALEQKQSEPRAARSGVDPQSPAPVRRSRTGPPQDRSPQILATYDAALRSTPIDRQFQAEMTERISKAFSSEKLRPIAPTVVTCGTTMCRLEVDFKDDPIPEGEDILSALGAAAPHGGIYLNRTLLGARRGVMFIAKRGEALPPVSSPDEPAGDAPLEP
jgi:hypothetical protein